MTLSKQNWVTVLLVFIGTFLTYAALTPGSIEGMGYSGEEMRSGDSMIAMLEARLHQRPAPPVKLSRNGFLSVALDLPFLAIGQRIISEDFILSIEPILDSALLVTILFVWLRRLTSPGLAILLALAAAFGTMLWPYAYIGLETKQSLYLLLSGWLALEGRPIQSFWRAAIFGLCCALAIGVKANGMMLLPAVGYLIYAHFRGDWRRRLPFTLTALAVAGFLTLVNAAARSQYYLSLGVTTFTQFRSTMVDNAFQYLGSLIGLFGSPTKGLLLYAPLLLLSLYSISAAWRARRDLTLFVLLIVGGLVAGFALVIYYADETWGARYLHSCVAPLVLLIGASRSRFSWRRDFLMIPLTALGAVISFLGAFYYYGSMHAATIRAGENNLAELVGDAKWNQIAFNGRLFAIWWKSPSGPVLWTPAQHWMWGVPADARPAKTINLAEWAQPQAMLLRLWSIPPDGRPAIWILLLLAGVTGLTILAIAVLWYRPPPETADSAGAGRNEKIETVAKLPGRVFIPIPAGVILLGVLLWHGMNSPALPARRATPKSTVPRGAAAVGYLDVVDNKPVVSPVISATGGSQVHVSGWAGCADATSPLARLEIVVDGRTVADASLSHPRPDVGAGYDRPDFNNSGWQADFSTTGIAAGSHRLSARPICAKGESATLSQFELIVTSE